MSSDTDFVVVGTTIDFDKLRLEEHWMKRIELLEGLYDEQMRILQKEFLADKVSKRLLTSLNEQNSKFRKRIQNLETYTKELGNETTFLEQKTKKQETRHKTQMKDLNFAKKEISTQKKYNLEVCRSANAAVGEKEVIRRKMSLMRTEQQKMSYTIKERDIDLKNLQREYKRVEGENENLIKQLSRVRTLPSNLPEMKSHKVQQPLEIFFGVENTSEAERLLRMKIELKQITKAFRTERFKNVASERQREFSEERLKSLQSELMTTLEKLDSLTLKSKEWKHQIKHTQKAQDEKVHSIAKSDAWNSKDRLKKTLARAEFKHRLEILERKINELEQDRNGLSGKVKSLTTLHNSLVRIHEKNARQRKTFCDEKHLAQRSVLHLPPSGATTQDRTKLQQLETDLLKSRRLVNVLKFKLKQNSSTDQMLKESYVELLQVKTQTKEIGRSAKLAIQRIGQRDNPSAWNPKPLQESLYSQIEFAQNLRQRLPPLIPNVENVTKEEREERLLKLRKELLQLERKYSFEEFEADLQTPKQNLDKLNLLQADGMDSKTNTVDQMKSNGIVRSSLSGSDSESLAGSTM